MENIKLTFDNSVKEDILAFLNKEVNQDGEIVEKNNSSEKVLTFEGEEISIQEFGGVQKGSEVFIKNDVISLLRLSKLK